MAELTALMDEFEAAEEENDDEGAAGEEGIGDLLDDFVLQATQANAVSLKLFLVLFSYYILQ